MCRHGEVYEAQHSGLTQASQVFTLCLILGCGTSLQEQHRERVHGDGPVRGGGRAVLARGAAGARVLIRGGEPHARAVCRRAHRRGDARDAVRVPVTARFPGRGGEPSACAERRRAHRRGEVLPYNALRAPVTVHLPGCGGEPNARAVCRRAHRRGHARDAVRTRLCKPVSWAWGADGARCWACLACASRAQSPIVLGRQCFLSTASWTGSLPAVTSTYSDHLITCMQVFALRLQLRAHVCILHSCMSRTHPGR